MDTAAGSGTRCMQTLLTSSRLLDAMTYMVMEESASVLYDMAGESRSDVVTVVADARRAGARRSSPRKQRTPLSVTTSSLSSIGGWPIQPVRVCVGSK